MTLQRQWTEIGITMSRDPQAKLACPVCGFQFLEVVDSDPVGEPPLIDRYVRCPSCGEGLTLSRLPAHRSESSS